MLRFFRKLSYQTKFFASNEIVKSASCWNCKKKHLQHFLVCGGCRFLQEPNDSIYKLDYFVLFGMLISLFFLFVIYISLRGKSFDIEEKILDKKFKELQMNFHPDRQKPNEKVIKQNELFMLEILRKLY